MRRLIGIFAALYLALIIVGVAHGQERTPAPSPLPTTTPGISQGSQSIITELNKTGEIITGAMDRQGTSQVVLVLIVIIVLAIVIVLIRHTIASNTESNRALVQMASGQQAREQNYITLITGLQTTIAANTTAINSQTEQSKSRQLTDKDVVTVLTSVYDTNLTMKTLVNKFSSSITDQMRIDKRDLNTRLDLIVAGLRSLKADVPEQAPRIDAIEQAVEETRVPDPPTIPTITPEEVQTLSDTGRLLDRLNKEN